MKVHCLFEQSGTFKNEFRKLGINAYDYDIQNEFNQTDYVIDLFKEDINLITELVNENFKENVETNLEHYKDRIIELCSDELAISKGKLLNAVQYHVVNVILKIKTVTVLVSMK